MGFKAVILAFEELANTVLPKKFKNLKKKKTFLANTLLNSQGQTLKKLNLEKDFKGLYIFWHNGKPVYTGISQKIIRRLRNHVGGTTHFQATLAYRIAKEIDNHTGKRAELNFEKGKNRVRKMSVSFIEINCPVERYLLEVYVASKYKCKYNSFETH